MPEPNPKHETSKEDKAKLKRPNEVVPSDEVDEDDGYGDSSPDPIIKQGP